MINNELYDSIISANIKESLLIISKILLKNKDKNIDFIQNTFITICSYIGTFISVYDIRLWLNLINDLIYFIENDNIIITDIYVIITKMCLLCDIYIKNPTIKTSSLQLKFLRDKFIDLFDNNNFKLSTEGISKFEGIIPPSNSSSYSLSLQIITGYVYIYRLLKSLSLDHKDQIYDISVKIRNSFDYIIRKKYSFETKFYQSDNDSVWFLWGIISLLFIDTELDILYQLFCISYTKKIKSDRIGILYGAAISTVYLTKKDIARNWNDSELKVIQKIKEVSLDLYNDIKRNLISSGEIAEEKPFKINNINGIDFIINFKPNITKIINSDSNLNQTDETKYIKCKNKYMT